MPKGEFTVAWILNIDTNIEEVVNMNLYMHRKTYFYMQFNSI